jgi:hypothetical protein
VVFDERPGSFSGNRRDPQAGEVVRNPSPATFKEIRCLLACGIPDNTGHFLNVFRVVQSRQVWFFSLLLIGVEVVHLGHVL